MLTHVKWSLPLDQRRCAVSILIRRSAAVLFEGDRPLSKVLHSRHLSKALELRFGRRQTRSGYRKSHRAFRVWLGNKAITRNCRLHEVTFWPIATNLVGLAQISCPRHSRPDVLVRALRLIPTETFAAPTGGNASGEDGEPKESRNRRLS